MMVQQKIGRSNVQGLCSLDPGERVGPNLRPFDQGHMAGRQVANPLAL